MAIGACIAPGPASRFCIHCDSPCRSNSCPRRNIFFERGRAGCAPGTSPVTVSDAIVLNSALVAIGVEQASGSVTVEGNVVPEPTHYAFVAALIFAGLLTVRRRNSARTRLN